MNKYIKGLQPYATQILELADKMFKIIMTNMFERK